MLGTRLAADCSGVALQGWLGSPPWGLSWLIYPAHLGSSTRLWQGSTRHMKMCKFPGGQAPNWQAVPCPAFCCSNRVARSALIQRMEKKTPRLGAKDGVAGDHEREPLMWSVYQGFKDWRSSSYRGVSKLWWWANRALGRWWQQWQWPLRFVCVSNNIEQSLALKSFIFFFF